LPPHLLLEDYGDWELRPTYTWKEPAPGTSADCAIAHAAQTAIEAASCQINPDEYYPQALLSIVEEHLELLVAAGIRAALDEARLPSYEVRFEALLPTVEPPSVRATLPAEGRDATEEYTGLIRGVYEGIYAGISEVISEEYAGNWAENVQERHRAIFGTDIPTDLLETLWPDDLGGAFSPPRSDVPDADMATYRIAFEIGRSRGCESIHTIVHAFAEAGGEDLDAVPSERCGPLVAFALDDAISATRFA